jgi:crotonobetainyl-CoA:carnitine CoA-transferase CaiB-like acyl-CoA transferase
MNTQGALAGLKVIDLSRVLGGPYCTQILGDHGADVIKVEPPQGDETRGWGPPFREGVASYYSGVYRHKRGIVLDLKQPQAREALLGLLAGADVLVENFKPGTLDKWGMDAASLATRFPRLIHCRISGFGADGPLGGLPGYDAAVQAMVGLMSINGEPDGAPTRLGVPVVDLATGLNAVIGILMAVREREASGRGQFVETTLYDCGFSLLHPHLANHFMSGATPGRSGNAHPNITPYDVFETGTVPIFLAVGNDGQFAKLCALLGRPELAQDERFANNGERSHHRETLKRELTLLLASREGEKLAEELIRAGVPCGPVLNVADAAWHPHTHHREMVVERGDYKGTGSPIKLSRTPASYRLLPPALGEHNDEVLGTDPGLERASGSHKSSGL